jgi:hypothetical protein
MITRLTIGTFCCLGILIHAAGAAPILVPNFSFQDPVTPGFQDNAGILAGAPLPNMSNSWYYLGGFSAGGSPVGVETTAANGNQAGGAGTQNGYINVGASMGSANLGVIAANETYFLTVSVAGRFNGFNSTSGATIALASVASGTPGDTNLANPANWLVSQSIAFSTLQSVGNAFADYQITFNTGSSGGGVGGQLVAVLMSQDNPGSNNPIAFDNVRVNTDTTCGLGDVDCNGLINLTDFTAIRNHFRLTVGSRAEGDLSGDGKVDFTDFREWKSNYVGPFTGFESVPEPASALLMGLGVIALCGKRRGP